MPGRPEQFNRGKGALMLTKLSDGGHRLHFVAQVQAVDLTMEESWSYSLDSGLGHSESNASVWGRYESARSTTAVCSNLNMDGNM